MTLVVDALAAFRLTRLVTADKITAPTRDRIIRGAYARRGDTEARSFMPQFEVDWTARAQDDGLEAPRLAQWISCSWCAGFWCATVVVVARRVVPRVWAPAAEALALSSAVGLLRTAETAL